MEKARKIINSTNITEGILESIKLTFPYGFDDDDLVKFVNAAGEKISALPIETEDARYLIKIGVEMNKKIDAYMEDDDDSEAEAVEEETDFPDEETSETEDDD